MAVATVTQPAETAVARRRLTAADLDSVHVLHEGDRVDLIDGEMYVTPAPDANHQAVLSNLDWLIQRWVRERQAGKLYFSPFAVHLSEHDVVQPDLVYLTAARTSLVRRRGVFGAPDLIVEALSPSTRGLDLGERRALYERAGVREYWVADPAAGTIAQHVLTDGRFAEVAAEDGLLHCVVLPGLVVDPAEVFADLPDGDD